MECKDCGTQVPTAKRACQACGADNGFPNVRMAERVEEKAALADRLHVAEVSATARGCKDVLDRFGISILQSRAVIARPLATLFTLLESDKRNYSSFAQELRAGCRVAEENEFDEIRTQFESALFPNFHEEILFASLSLGVGLAAYGPYLMVLKTELIKNRATVFEENPYNFAARHGLRMTDKIPFGFRALWGQRDAIAKAKLYAQISDATSDDDFPGILLKDGSGTAGGSYIEVHVYGPINQHTIERVVCRKPTHAADRVILKKIERNLKALGASLEIV